MYPKIIHSQNFIDSVTTFNLILIYTFVIISLIIKHIKYKSNMIYK